MSDPTTENRKIEDATTRPEPEPVCGHPQTVAFDLRGELITVPKETLQLVPGLLARAEASEGPLFINRKGSDFHRLIDHLLDRKPGCRWEWKLFDTVGADYPIPDSGCVRIEMPTDRFDIPRYYLADFPSLRESIRRDPTDRYDQLVTDQKLDPPVGNKTLTDRSLVLLGVPLLELPTTEAWQVWLSINPPVFSKFIRECRWVRYRVDPSWVTQQLSPSCCCWKPELIDGVDVPGDGWSSWTEYRIYGSEYQTLAFLEFPKEHFDRFAALYEAEHGHPLKQE